MLVERRDIERGYKMRKLTNYEQDLISRLQNKEEAACYLNIAFEEYLKDNDTKSFCLSLYYLSLARGGVSKIAEETGLNRENLHKIFTGKRKPRLETLNQLLSPEFKLAIVPR
jgi:probable addiction module antidote protein